MRHRYRLLVFFSILLLSRALFAGPAIVVDYEFEAPVIGRAHGYDVAKLPGCVSSGEVGSPSLPMKGSMLLLPPGEVIREVRVSKGEIKELDGAYDILPMTEQVPLSLMEELALPPFKDEAVYTSEEPIPAEDVLTLKSEMLRGHRLAVLNLFPVKYSPASGKLAYYERMTVEIFTQPSVEAMDATMTMLRTDDRTARSVAGAVDNPEMLEVYAGLPVSDASGISPVLDQDEYDYLIITTATYESDFQVLADFKNSRGVKAAVVLKSDILASYTGVDDQDEIRKFLKDAYTGYGTSYVLFGGDDELLPHRGLYADVQGSYPDDDIAGDLYFAGLDRNGSGSGPDWNVDNDSRWGEPSEADLAPELFIGRAAIDSHNEAQNFIQKQIMYQSAPVVADILDALLLGEDLGWLVWGGEYMEELRLGSSNWGYTTAGFEPGIFTVDHLYDMEGYWSTTTLINKLNNGVNMVHHLGHATNDYDMKLYNSDIGSFTNDGINESFFIHYTQGCYCNSWDNRTTGGGYTGDAFSEVYTVDNNAAVCFIGNSRYGWGNLYNTDGSSQYYDRQFVDGIFGEDLFHIGETEADSRIDNIPFINLGANRFCHYELGLLGDPELDMWTDIPVDPDVSHPATVPIGLSDFTVTVTDGGMPIEGALVAATQDGGLFERGYTNAAGSVTLSLLVESADIITVSVTAHNYYHYTGPVQPISEGAYISYYDHLVDDDATGESYGDGDGIAGCGETLELPVELRNWGADDAYGVTAVMTIDDAYATLTDGSETFGDIAAGASVWSADDFGIEIDRECHDGHAVSCNLHITDTSDESWESGFNLLIAAPALTIGDYEIFDPVPGGNGNGVFEPGEVGTLTFTLDNDGSASATGIGAELLESDPYVTLTQTSATFPDIAPGGSAENTPVFEVEIDGSCPSPHTAALTLQLTGDWFDETLIFDLLIMDAGFIDDMESGEGDWTHYAVTGGYVDEWHMSTQRAYSASHSWKCGSTGSGDYANYADGGLVTPEIVLPANAVLTFWHWIDAELDSGIYAWDGAIVEISTNGGASWTQITPDGGYPYRITDNPASPFEPNTPCFSGSYTWQQETFQLGAYSGAVNIRFRFGTDGYVTEEGWYIDDVMVMGAGAVSITLTPDTTVIAKGETMGITFDIHNGSGESKTFDVWTEVTMPGGDPYSGNPHLGPVSVTLASGGTITSYQTFVIPMAAPTGVYGYEGLLGDYPGTVWDTDSFDLEITD